MKNNSVHLADIAEFRNGVNFTASDKGHRVRVVGVADFQDRSVLNAYDSLGFVHLSNPLSQDDKLRDGDLLFVRSNGNKRLIGRCILVSNPPDDVTFSGFTIRARIDRSKVLPVFMANVFRIHNVKQQILLAGGGTNISNLSQAILAKIEFYLPCIAEQGRIVQIIGEWDDAIEKTEQLIAAKERHYTHELSRFISRVQHPQHHISEFAREVSERNRAGACERVLSVTNDRGFVLPEHQFERRVASEDVSNYKVVRKGQYAYNPSRINVGSIARLDDYDMGVLSPMYAVFAIDEAKVNSDFFKHWLDSHEARERIKRSAQGSVRETESFTDFATIRFPLPLLEQQQKIANYLNALRDEITLLAAYAGKLKEQKRGLMQKLLTGQWRLNTVEEMSA